MPPLNPHSDPPMMPSLHHYKAQQLHSHVKFQPQERHQADPSPLLIARHGWVRDMSIGACRNRRMQFVISSELREKTLKMQYDFTIAVRRPLQTASTLMQAYRTARSCEGYGYLCVRRLVHGVCDIGRAASLNFRYELKIADRS